MDPAHVKNSKDLRQSLRMGLLKKISLDQFDKIEERQAIREKKELLKQQNNLKLQDVEVDGKQIQAETIDAEKALSKVAEKPAYSDMQKQLIAKSVASMGGQKQQMQPDLKIINAQQAFAQMPDATQPQQIQEFKPEQMAMMLRRRNGGY
jgi:Mg-chelatase subunit ChlI